ncbi:hypothetical protein YC2023_057824 [Brassica napus]
MVASMRTPRTRFACAAVSGKVYVAGGCNLTQSSGVSSAEVYDPVADSNNAGSFHELRAGEQISTQAFNPLEMSWSTVVDIWPLPRRMNYAVQVMKNDRLYSIVIQVLGGRLIQTRGDTDDEGEWYTLGSVPCVVVLPDDPREPQVLGHGFAALRDELYVIGGRFLKLEKSGSGGFERLSVVRVCDPLVRPLVWREAKPMCLPADGPITGSISPVLSFCTETGVRLQAQALHFHLTYAQSFSSLLLKLLIDDDGRYIATMKSTQRQRKLHRCSGGGSYIKTTTTTVVSTVKLFPPLLTSSQAHRLSSRIGLRLITVQACLLCSSSGDPPSMAVKKPHRKWREEP